MKPCWPIMIAFAFGIFFADFLHRQAQFKAGAHPGHVGHFAAKDFLRQFLATFADAAMAMIAFGCMWSTCFGPE